MKNKIQYIPLTAFAAATLLGGALHAEQTNHGTRLRVQGAQQTQGQMHNQMQGQQSNRAHAQPMKASDLLGMNIDTHADEKVGEIDEIYIHTGSGEVLAMVVSTGGFLGMGQQQSLISPDDLRLNGERSNMQTDLNKDQIGTSPQYKKNETAVSDRVRPMGRNAMDREQHRARANRNQERQHAGSGYETSQARSDRTDRNERMVENHRGLAISDLMGMDVENRQGESIGKVDEVFIDLEEQEVVGVVVSTGGFLGIGDRKTLFGMEEMTLDVQNEKVVLDYNRDQIRRFPEFKPDEQNVFEDLRERLDRLDLRSRDSDARDAARNESRNEHRNQARMDNRNEARTEARTDIRTGTQTDGRTSSMTIFNQGNTSEEIDMTASIRSAIRENDNLSRRANNVTIITNNDRVLLRGEVDSASEKSSVEGIAYSKAGRANVNSELTVRSR